MIGAQSQGLPPQPMAQIAKAQPVKGQRDHLGRACRSTRVELFTPTALRRLKSICMIGSSSIHAHQSTYFAINPSCAMCTKSIVAMKAGTMTTNLEAELPGYGTVSFDPQPMTNVLSFGNIAKQYPIDYLQESDTFQVQLHDHVNINLYVLEGHQPQEDCQSASSSQENISPISVTSHVQTIEENTKFLTPKEIAQANVAK